jgi:[acyl-carrier-protein] S-malonyltransferase
VTIPSCGGLLKLFFGKMKKFILGFPGQGTQKLGLGLSLNKAFPSSSGRIFQQVNQDLNDIFNRFVWISNSDSPILDIHKTENAQPIILATSIACLEALKEVHGFSIDETSTDKQIGCLIGHSLGEFTALVAAKSLSLTHAVKLVKRRGELMQESTNVWGKQPAMAAVLGLSWDQATEIQANCPKGLLVEAASANGPEQTVLSGCTEGVSWGIERAKMVHKAKKGLRMNVSCPFHTTVMKSAAEKFAKELDGVRFSSPKIPIVFGYDCEPHSNTTGIKDALLKGMYSPVRWADSVRKAVEICKRRDFNNNVLIEFREIGGDVLRFGVANVPGLIVGKPCRPTSADVESFTI